jgi:hypothetical protein
MNLINTSYAVGVDAGRIKGVFACGSTENDILFSGFGRLRPKPEKYNGCFSVAPGGKQRLRSRGCSRLPPAKNNNCHRIPMRNVACSSDP